MKKTPFLILFAFLVAGTLAAQDSLNFKWLVGGGFNFNSSNSETPEGQVKESSSDEIGINTYFLRKLSRHWYIGGGCGFTVNAKTQVFVAVGGGISKRVIHNYDYSVQAGGRLVVNPAKRLRFNLEPAIYYNHYKNINVAPDKNEFKSKSNSINFVIGVMCSYQASERVNFVLNTGGLSYHYYWSKSGEDYKIKQSNNSFGLNFSMRTLYFGFEYLFGR